MYEKMPTTEQKFNLEEFKSEIKRLKEVEDKESQSVHLSDLNPEKLNENDQKMYEGFLAIKDKEGLEKYINELEEYKSKLRQDSSTSQDQKDFVAFLGNMVMGKMGELLL